MDNRHEDAIVEGQTMHSGELAIQELELVISSHRGIICALVMCSAVSVLTCTLLLAGVVIAFTESGISPPSLMLLCGGLNTVAAVFLYLCLKPLTADVTRYSLDNLFNRPVNQPEIR
jgi:hypothetical protein